MLEGEGAKWNGVCVFLLKEAGRQGRGWQEISADTNQPRRVRSTASLDAGQRISPFSLRPQPRLRRLPGDRERQRVLKWMCPASSALPRNPCKMKGTDIAAGMGWGALWDGGCPGSLVCLTQELTYPLPIPGGVSLPLSQIAVGQAAQRGQATAHSHPEAGRAGIRSTLPPAKAAPSPTGTIRNKEAVSAAASETMEAQIKKPSDQLSGVVLWLWGHSGTSTLLPKGLPGRDGKETGQSSGPTPAPHQPLSGALHSG